MWVGFFFYFWITLCYSTITRMVEYKNGTRKLIKQDSIQFRSQSVLQKAPIYTFNIILYDCTNANPNLTLVNTIYTYLYEDFFPHVKNCSNNTVSKMDAFIYGPYYTLPCNTNTCSDSLLSSMEDRSMQVIDRQMYIPSIITVFINPRLCDYLAMADVLGNRIVINGLHILFSKNILLHEWGHNLGLHHSTFNMDEYGDNTCAMGRSTNKPLCFNAAHSHLLNWIDVKILSTRKLKGCIKLKSQIPYAIDETYYISYQKPALLIHKIHDPEHRYTRLLTRLKRIQKTYSFPEIKINLTWRYKNNYIHLNICK
jgi:hypothetical protein